MANTEDGLTPEALAEWMGAIEDKVWAAARDAAAARFVTGNLVLELGRTGLIDAEPFIRRLLAEAAQHPDQPKAVREFLEELLTHQPSPGEGGGGGGHGAPPGSH